MLQGSVLPHIDYIWHMHCPCGVQQPCSHKMEGRLKCPQGLTALHVTTCCRVHLGDAITIECRLTWVVVSCGLLPLALADALALWRAAAVAPFSTRRQR